MSNTLTTSINYYGTIFNISIEREMIESLRLVEEVVERHLYLQIEMVVLVQRE